MMKVIELLKKKDVGSIGIGAMIVFIAMVLVAGIAASVLIQTSTTLETQALATGSETTDEVSGGIAVFDVEGHVSTDIDGLAMAREGLVNRVVHQLENHVVQPGSIVRVADIHPGSLANRIQALEDLDALGVVVISAFAHGFCSLNQTLSNSSLAVTGRD